MSPPDKQHPQAVTSVLGMLFIVGYNLTRFIMTTSVGNESYFRQVMRRHIALPQDHGSWVFLFSPLLIGLFAGENWSPASFFLIVGALAGFLIRQPLTIAVKVYSGRRSRRDLPAAQFWTGVYAVIGLLAVGALIALGFGYLLYLAVPGVPVFIWHLYLVSKRSERRQVGVELVATGVLSLAAPAAYWVGLGQPDVWGWVLFGLVWLQSAASIVYAYLRLQQRELKIAPPVGARLQMGWRALLYTTFNLLLAAGGAIAGWLPPLVPLPFAVQWAETIWGVLNPAVGFKPTKIGIRQLIVSTFFTVLFILVWRA